MLHSIQFRENLFFCRGRHQLRIFISKGQRKETTFHGISWWRTLKKRSIHTSGTNILFQSRLQLEDHLSREKSRYSSKDVVVETKGMERKREEEGKTAGQKKFISFFDEIDAIARDRENLHLHSASSITTSKVHSGRNGSPIKAKIKLNPPDLKSLLLSMDERERTVGHQTNPKEEDTTNIFGVLDALPEVDQSHLHSVSQSDWVAGNKENAKTEDLPSIFDAFPIPEQPSPRGANHFDIDAYAEYASVLKDVLASARFGKRNTKNPLAHELLNSVETWLRHDERASETIYPTLDTALQNGIASLGDEARASFKTELKNQKEKFMKKQQWTDEQHESATWALVAVGNRCARLARSLPLDICWEKVKEAGIQMTHTSLDTYLYACTTYSTKSKPAVFEILGSNSGIDKAESGNGGTEYLPGMIATFHDILYEPSEQSLSIRVRGLVAKGEAKRAEDLLDSVPVLKHRTYLPVLKFYLEEGDISSALKIFKTMRDLESVHIETETYVQLISAMAENGFFSANSPPVEGAEALGYSAAFGPLLFDQIASEMADDILEISSASARRLYSAFFSAFKSRHEGRNLGEIHPLAPVPQVDARAQYDEVIANRVRIDEKTGICPRSGAKLRLINLEEDQRQRLHKSLADLSNVTFVDFKSQFGWRHLDESFAAAELNKFASWLDTRDGRPFTAIIDGANIAYYMQNFERGKFNVYQIKFMVNALERIEENPLVILPFKYQQDFFKVRKGSKYFKQTLDKGERAILDDLTKSGKLYTVPKYCLDDFYWMLASISDQSNSRKGADLSVPPESKEERWAGPRPALISNDQMRDHKLGLLEPRLFRRWYSCHMVNYSFTAFVDDECVDDGISFGTADLFSREIQGNLTQSSSSVEEGLSWHFPVSDWDLNERFCIRLPKLK